MTHAFGFVLLFFGDSRFADLINRALLVAHELSVAVDALGHRVGLGQAQLSEGRSGHLLTRSGSVIGNDHAKGRVAISG